MPGTKCFMFCLIYPSQTLSEITFNSVLDLQKRNHRHEPHDQLKVKVGIKPTCLIAWLIPMTMTLTFCHVFLTLIEPKEIKP